MDQPTFSRSSLAGLAIAALYGAATFITQIACTPARPAPLVLSPVAHEETLADVKERPDAGARLGIPLKPEAFQKTPPCDHEMGEVPINGACYAEMAKRPPCGKLREHDGRCYRPIAKPERDPTSIKK